MIPRFRAYLSITQNDHNPKRIAAQGRRIIQVYMRRGFCYSRRTYSVSMVRERNPGAMSTALAAPALEDCRMMRPSPRRFYHSLAFWTLVTVAIGVAWRTVRFLLQF